MDGGGLAGPERRLSGDLTSLGGSHSLVMVAFPSRQCGSRAATPRSARTEVRPARGALLLTRPGWNRACRTWFSVWSSSSG